MNKQLKKIMSYNEFYIFITIVIVCILIEFRSGQFFTPNNIVDLLSAMIVPALFAIGAFLVIVSGGIDVSFPALASLTIYIVTSSLKDINFNGSIFIPIAMTIVIGGLLGAFNGLLIGKFKYPALIITLGTQSVFRGIMQGALNAIQIPKIPQPMEEFGYSSLFVAQNSVTGMTSRMPVTFLILVVVLAVVFFLLKYTMFGRAIFAIGGNETSAERAGFDVLKTKVLLYTLVGSISGLAGFIRTCMMGQCHPTNMLGMEMMVIASVVLGGTAIVGGKGTLIGAMLGTALIIIVENSLILLGIPTFWQGFFLGALIIIGTGISAFQITKSQNKLVGLKDS